ncbi:MULTISPECIES: fluoride efflux transporter FluC [unclassified Streptomyces]|uniref:fluoride efflux transporter FluC n=1 Tax=unclassified Streptomyces TaxID=2593676 RepID=UPI000A91A536
MNWLLVVAGALVGAPARYAADRWITARSRGPFPWGTLSVNVFACLVLGLVTGAALAGAASSHVVALLGTGLCGALSTYSTLSYEALRLAETGAGRLALGYALLSMAAGLGAGCAGVAVATGVWG